MYAHTNQHNIDIGIYSVSMYSQRKPLEIRFHHNLRLMHGGFT